MSNPNEGSDGSAGSDGIGIDGNGRSNPQRLT